MTLSDLSWLFAPSAADDDVGARPRSIRRVIEASAPRSLLALAPDLVSRLQKREPSAYDEVLAVAGPRLVSFAATIVGSRDAAEDVVQDVLLGIWRRGPAFDVRGAPLAHWLFSATRNAALSLLRHEARTHRREQRAAEDSATDEVRNESPWDDELEALRQALSQLTEHQRTAFTLRYGHDMTIPEVARVLGITPKGAERLFTRIGKLLREHLGAR